MNFSQLHERLRLEVLRRRDNGSLSAALLANQVGCSAAHISNFLNSKRRLSIELLDKVMVARGISLADLLPQGRHLYAAPDRAIPVMSSDSVPLVEPLIAASSARIHSDLIIEFVKVRSGLLGDLRDKCSAQRRKWDRFTAVRISEEEAVLMQPVLPARSIVLIDRHYNSPFAYSPDIQTIYAVRTGNRLRFRYVLLVDRQLVFTAHNPLHAPELIALSDGQTSAHFLVGRVFLIQSLR